jgi:hypothetical protein
MATTLLLPIKETEPGNYIIIRYKGISNRISALFYLTSGAIDSLTSTLAVAVAITNYCSLNLK